jgi:sortase A
MTAVGSGLPRGAGAPEMTVDESEPFVRDTTNTSSAMFACFTILPTRTKRFASHLTMPAAALAMALGLVLIGQGVWIHAKALVAQVLLERAFAQTLTTGKNEKPWSWADTWPVARIDIPRLGKSAIVLNGSSGQALAFGPGHVERTPEAGEPGTAVYAAHRDTHFAFIGDVRVGDEIRVTRRDGAIFRYRVTSTSVVRWDASGIDPQVPGSKLVLATCWPLHAQTAGPLRYLVQAELMPAMTSTSGDRQRPPQQNPPPRPQQSDPTDPSLPIFVTYPASDIRDLSVQIRDTYHQEKAPPERG